MVEEQPQTPDAESKNPHLRKVNDTMLDGLGQLADYFGFPKVMGQLYGTLLLSSTPLSLDELMRMRASRSLQYVLTLLSLVVAILLLVAGFFSLAETSMMALNRYRLKHLVKQGNRGARLTQSLLDRTDRLLGVILLGNNLVNTAASMLALLIAERLFGQGEATLTTLQRILSGEILEAEGIYIPVITTLHGTDITLVGRDKMYAPVVAFSINQSDAITAVSDNLRDETFKIFDITKRIAEIFASTADHFPN